MFRFPAANNVMHETHYPRRFCCSAAIFLQLIKLLLKELRRIYYTPTKSFCCRAAKSL